MTAPAQDLARRRAADGRALPVTLYIAALALTLAWAAAVIAFAWSFRGGSLFETPFGLAALAMIAVGPGALIGAAAYLVRQGATLAAQERRMVGVLESLAAARETSAAERDPDGLRRELEQSQTNIASLRAALAFECDRLNGAAAASLRTAGELSAAMSSQRAELETMLDQADGRFRGLAHEIAERTRAIGGELDRMVGHLTEIEGVLAANAARAHSAADGARELVSGGADRLAEAARSLDASVGATVLQMDQTAERLARQHQEIQGFSENLREQGQALGLDLRVQADQTAAYLQEARNMLAELHASVQALTEAMARVEAQGQQMPERTRAQAEEIQSVFAGGLERLMQAQREVTQHVESVDSAFEARVRRNFDLLAEAIRMVGVMAGGPTPSPPAGPAPTTSPARPAEPPQVLHSPGETTPAEPSMRLKLTPITDAPEPAETLEPVKSLEPAAGDELIALEKPAPSPAEAADAQPTPSPTGQSDPRAERLLADLSAWGVQPTRALSDRQARDVAAALQRGGREAARAVVRRFASGPVRKLGGRLAAGPEARARAREFVGAWDSAWEEDHAPPPGALMTREGRLYLLLDTALADIGS